MNPMGTKAGIQPQTLFVGKNPDNDQFIRRYVSQLNDIEFSDSDEPEEIHNLRRQPHTVLTEENLKEYLNDQTVKVNLENHYWISNSFISKIGRMSPNLLTLSLRRMPQITNQIFAEVFEHLSQLQTVDLCDCDGLYPTALQLLLRKNPNLEQIQLSGCNNAVDDKAIRLMSGLANLEFLDISYCKQVTDQGLVHFSDKKLPITSLVINGVQSVTSAGVAALLNCCMQTLVDLEAGDLD